jgi:hypothetical protein
MNLALYLEYNDLLEIFIWSFFAVKNGQFGQNLSKSKKCFTALSVCVLN